MSTLTIFRQLLASLVLLHIWMSYHAINAVLKTPSLVKRLLTSLIIESPDGRVHRSSAQSRKSLLAILESIH
jgi:hypothetical protein